MFKVGNLIYIKDYDFEDGLEPKNRYHIIIDKQDGKLVLLNPITTQYTGMLEKTKVVYGCNEISRKHHYFHFPKNKQLTQCGFCLPLDSYTNIGMNIQEKEIYILEGVYRNNINLKGRLTYKVYTDLVYCIYKSPKASDKVVKRMEDILDIVCSSPEVYYKLGV
jgi:hypothetical protein